MTDHLAALEEIAKEMRSIAPTCEPDWESELQDWASRLSAAIALMRGQSEKSTCEHENTQALYDGVVCHDCYAFRTDSGWGIAKNRWFTSRDEADFFQKNGRLPQQEPAE